MKPVQQILKRDALELDGLFFDLDDTLLDEGCLSEEAYSALFLLKKSGLRLIALTGRPASWGELLARMWPIEAAIAENGALAFKREGARVKKLDTVEPEERELRQEKLSLLVSKAQKKFPSLVPAEDIRGRISDYTFDIGEHERAGEALIQEARLFAQRAGARTTRSSVHLHYTYDRFDKATGALSYLRKQGEDPTRSRSRFAFIGDSENDVPAFSAFRLTCGVGNLRGRFSIPPRFITKQKASHGFCEFAARLSQLR